MWHNIATNMPNRYSISKEEAAAHLNYDPETGQFTWRANKGRAAKAGAIAGSVHRSGYRRIGVCGALVYAHRLAWLMHYGREPIDEIDHINGARDDNRIANLREADNVINAQNRRSALPNSRSGVLGVVSDKNGGVWAAHITFMGKIVRVGGFSSIEDAHAMYIELKRRLHDGCAI